MPKVAAMNKAAIAVVFFMMMISYVIIYFSLTVRPKSPKETAQYTLMGFPL